MSITTSTTAKRYSDIVENDASLFGTIKYVFKDNRSDSLIVMIGTHNQRGKFPSLVRMYDDASLQYDVLFLSEIENTYYQLADSGQSYLALIDTIVSRYEGKKVIFFGASMAGYCAILWALKFEAGAVVSNPQVDLNATRPHAWIELTKTINKAKGIEEIISPALANRRAAIVSLWSCHPMDLANFEKFLELVSANVNLSVSIERDEETNHKFLIRGHHHFMKLVNRCQSMFHD